MKTLFLLSGLITFSFASGQNNDLFDVNQHLKKLNSDKKAKLEKQNLFKPFNDYSGLFGTKKTKSFFLLNGDKVITLPQYNMPCVVPAMKKFQSMPNAGNSFDIKRNKYGAIPNPSSPLYIEELINKSRQKIVK